MTKEEIIDQIGDLVDALRDQPLLEPDAEKGKAVWPLPEDELVGYNDALATLWDIADCDLCLTWYGEDGNTLTDTLSVLFAGHGALSRFPCYARKPLIELLREELALYASEENASGRSARLLSRLIKAFDEDESVG